MALYQTPTCDPRVESRRRLRSFLLGLMAGLPRVNCWTLAEHAGESSPAGMQHFLAGAVWDDDAIRAELRVYVVEHLGDPGGVLVVDETGDLKKGIHTVGVQRQYTGTAGRIENSQVAVYLTYATRRGHTFLDNALYLPESWTSDPERCQAAGIPDGTRFASLPRGHGRHRSRHRPHDRAHRPDRQRGPPPARPPRLPTTHPTGPSRAGLVLVATPTPGTRPNQPPPPPGSSPTPQLITNLGLEY